MLKETAVVLFSLALVGQVNTRPRDLIAAFDGGIGVIPVSNGAGAANADGTLPNARLNVVRGVSPGAGPWRIAALKAEIDHDGRIKVRGRGLAPGQRQQHRPERRPERLCDFDL